MWGAFQDEKECSSAEEAGVRRGEFWIIENVLGTYKLFLLGTPKCVLQQIRCESKHAKRVGGGHKNN